jgi:hypothetical protein
MFSTCIYCAKGLEHNDALETFPVGRRLAFDPVHGRLWVVCRACQRWNLSPLEERWEAIESAEKLFRDTRMRVSTDNIGMARLRDGVELIRIGDPQRPEMAAWRYGDAFGRRRKRQMIITGGVLAGAAVVVGAGVAAMVGGGAFMFVGGFRGMLDSIIHGPARAKIAMVNPGYGGALRVERRHARMSSLLQGEPGAPFALRLEHTRGTEILTGDIAMRAAAQILPAINRFGGSKKEVGDAVSMLEESGGSLKTVQRIQHRSGSKTNDRAAERLVDAVKYDESITGTFHRLPLRDRLALEMALHEEQEHRAMLGELQELERAWRDADEIARIADDMFD